MTATLGIQMLVLAAISQGQSGLLVLFGSVLAFVIPWPAALLLLRQGVVSAVVAVSACALLLGAIGGAALGGAYLMQFGVGSVVVPLLLKKSWHWDAAVLAGTGFSVAGGLSILSVYAFRLGQSPLAFADGWARTEVDRALTALKQAGLPADVAQQTEKVLGEVGSKLVALYPAITVLTVAGMLLVLVLFLNRRAGDILPVQVPFGSWKVAENLIWVLIASGAGVLLFEGAGHRFALNVLVIVAAIYFLQGLAITSYFLTVKGVPPAFRILGYFLVVASLPLRVLATGVGIFDLWIDFRKPRNRKD